MIVTALFALLPILPLAFAQAPHGSTNLARAARNIEARDNTCPPPTPTPGVVEFTCPGGPEPDCEVGYWIRSNNIPSGAHSQTLYLPSTGRDLDGYWYICQKYMGVYTPGPRTPLVPLATPKCTYKWIEGDSPDTPDTPDTCDSPDGLRETPELAELVPEIAQSADGKWYIGCIN